MRGEWNTKAVRDGLDAILCHAEAVYQANMANRKASLGGHLQPMLKDFHHMRMRVLPFPLPLLFFPQISLSHHLQANMANRKANMANRKASLGGHLQPMLKDFHHMRMRVLIPTYPCPYEERVGAWGVGGKWVCLIPTAVQAKPVVYSVGSDEEYSFEESMFRHYRSQPYTLDPFLSPQAQARMQLLRFLHFHSLGLAGKASLGDYQKWNPNVTFRTLPELMQDLNHTYVDILKLSCGGCEEEVIFDVYEGSVNGTAGGAGRGMREKVDQFRGSGSGGVRNYEEGREDAVDPSVGARLAINGGKLPFGQLVVDFHE
ncbi:unnamed protein product [Closterium sp. NIES-65]|nr:unnamed protein product [Closterium sp. NIES-65]